jgi:LCP family protein required for cell wall assembly
MKMNNAPDKKKKKNIVLWIISCLIFIIIVSAGVYIVQIFAELKPETEEGQNIRQDYKIDWSGRMNILVVGCDARSHLNLGARADTIILMNLDLDKKIVRIMSIPRDTWTEIPGHNCSQKINSTLNPAYWSDGGVGLTLKTVENMLKVPVKLYAQVDFVAFRDVVDALGGIIYNVEKDMMYTDRTDPETAINLKAGEQLLDGDKALQYCRFRWDAQGDFAVNYNGIQCGRTSRQLSFVKALGKKVIETNNLLTINSIINIVLKDTDTNIDSSELLKIALQFRNIDPETQIKSVVFPGNIDWVSNTSVILPNEEKMQILVEDEFIEQPEEEIVEEIDE